MHNCVNMYEELCIQTGSYTHFKLGAFPRGIGSLQLYTKTESIIGVISQTNRLGKTEI